MYERNKSAVSEYGGGVFGTDAIVAERIVRYGRCFYDTPEQARCRARTMPHHQPPVAISRPHDPASLTALLILHTG